MAVTYLFEENESSQAEAGTSILPENAPVQILSASEFDKLTFVPEDARNALCTLEKDYNSYIDIFPKYYLGSLTIPVRGDLKAPPEMISFYLDCDHLLIITEGNLPKQLLDEIAEDGKIPQFDCARCLFYILSQILLDDLGWLSVLEKSMEDLEERILSDIDSVSTKTIVKLRRVANLQGTFYQEIGDIAETLEDDTNDIVSESSSRRFGNLASHCDRLSSRATSLKDYSMQLHDIYQMQLDEKQNRIMEIFTIVTVVIAPLTLLTGWFGMNIKMPGLEFDFMWLFLLICAILISAGIIIFIHWKKWI